MRTSNPALNEKAFAVPLSGHKAMTVDGAINKSFILIALTVFTFLLSWDFALANPNALGFVLIGGLAAFIVALITIFKQEWSPVTAPIYALLEGALLGSISAVFEAIYPGIVFQAVGLTLAVFLSMLFVYKQKIIKVTDNFRRGLLIATFGIVVFYLVALVLSFFSISLPVFESGAVGIAFSLIVVAIAALNLLLDFDFIEKAAHRAPQYMEWYAGFGLLVTLIWLYLEILRLLAKLRDNR
ncbi:Bax inhibitor-1/YccA family protein [Candidatus Woesearchaeota archaeon]|nr:MAG: Bax inhibitor-1/YccA family protein [Candidatus Woesearchaeota archaeon]